MACRWRIRHKLMLGLGFVVGLVVLLLAGTIKGLASYRATVNMFDSKLVELHAMRNLKADLLPVSDLKACKIKDDFQQKVKVARDDLTDYEAKLRDTIERRRDPGGGFFEQQVILAMREHFAELDQAIDELDDVKYRKAMDALLRDTDDLYGEISRDLNRRIITAKVDFKSSFGIVVSVSILGILLMTGLLRFFYRWTFYPLRDLGAGVGRVAQGDFEHAIEVHSGDELEELAAAFNDMTGRLRNMYRDLARQVNERSRQLVRSERLAGVGFLAAGVAHEINNPLASIAFCSEALEARLNELMNPPVSPGQGADAGGLGRPGQDRELIAKYLKMIQEEAFRCKNITQRLLEFSRGGERSREPTDLVEVIQSVVDIAQHLPSSKGKNIIFAGSEGSLAPALYPLPGAASVGLQPDGGLVAWVNAQEIKSVVLNLVVNALESMDEGGTLTIQLWQRDRMAELVFADTGCGMSGEVLENIFEPFFTRSRTGKGTGLGLSISHRIINQHGGDVEAASPGPNQGSTFTVRIPLQPPEPAADEVPGRLAA